jgi:hypothetical protein
MSNYTCTVEFLYSITHGRSDRCKIIKYSELSDSNYTGQKFLLLLIYLGVKVIRGEFSLNYFCIYLFRGLRVLFCGIWSLHSWTAWWGTTQGVRRHHNVWCRCTITVDVETMMVYFVKEFCIWEYFCQMLQCQGFCSISFKIQGILLYLLYTVNFTGYHKWTLLWLTNHLFVGLHKVNRNSKRILLQPLSKIYNVSSFEKFYKYRLVYALKIRCSNWC